MGFMLVEIVISVGYVGWLCHHSTAEVIFKVKEKHD